MQIGYLADHPDFIRTLAQWHHREWSYLRPGESIALGRRALFGHDAVDQNAENEISFRHARAALFHVRGHIFRRLPENFLDRPQTWFPDWRAILNRTSGRTG